MGAAIKKVSPFVFIEQMTDAEYKVWVEQGIFPDRVRKIKDAAKATVDTTSFYVPPMVDGE